MKTSQYLQFLFATIIAFLVLLPSCKEKNDEYPPNIWYELSYTDNGIPLREISTIYYENDHSLWLGAQKTEGLLYNDGYKWITYNHDNTGINFDSITSITRDGNGKLWVGFKAGLASFDGTKWASIDEFKGLRITSVVVEGIGRIRVGIKGKSGGIATLHNGKWIFESPDNSTIPSSLINAMVSDNKQVLWLAAADNGVIKLLNSEWQNISNNLPLLSQNFTSITKSSSGSVWAASDASELIQFKNDIFSIYTTGTFSPVSSIVATNDTNVWCSTLGSGLIQFNGKNWKSYTMLNADLPSDHVVCLAAGNPGTLLFSLPGGRLYIINN